MSVSRETETPTMPSIGARELEAQLEHRVEGSTSQDSIALMVWSLSEERTSGAG